MIELLTSSLRLSAPLIFAAMGGLLCERAGVATICLEGVLLISAFTAASVDLLTLNPIASVVAGMFAGSIFMGLHAFLTQKAKTDHIISGVAINILAAGLPPLLSQAWFGSSTNTPSVPTAARLSAAWMIAISLVLPLGIHYLIYRTRFGLRIRSAGDGPEALQTAGVSVEKVRTLALLLGGALTSLGGSYLSIGHSSQFLRDMTAGGGFIALAAVIFGKWRPIPVLFASLFFGFTEALPMILQGISWKGISIPVQWIQTLPYLLTIGILVTTIGSARPPRAIGSNQN
ncbi:MAG: ABC transporter permease [Proteobacteria bacterium]|nr:ABC transporter permease [Pseudomonadota bacterium]